MVKTIKHGAAVYVHPSEKRLNFLVFRNDITRVYFRFVQVKTNGLMVCQTITQCVYLIQFIKHIRWVLKNRFDGKSEFSRDIFVSHRGSVAGYTTDMSGKKSRIKPI